MPRCIIKGCPNQTGQTASQKGIMLHGFPNYPIVIRRWLQATGQSFTDLDSIVDKIIEGKSNDLFRICSAHFSTKSYNCKGTKKNLKKDANPTIFLNNPDNIIVDEAWVLSCGKKRPKAVAMETGESSQSCKKCKRSLSEKTTKTFTDAGTQTEMESFNHSVRHASTQTSLVEQPVPLHFSTPLKNISSMTEGAQCLGTAMIPESPIITFPAQCSIPTATETEMDIQIQTVNEDSCTDKRSIKKRKFAEYVSFDTSTSTFSKPSSSEEEFDPGDITVTDSEQCSVTETVEEMAGVMAQESSDHEQDPLSRYSKMQKCIVFESCLDELLLKVKCQKSNFCQKKVIQISKQFHGSAIVVNGVCEDGHRFKIFDSQPKIKRHFAGNILLAAAIVCSGLNFQKVSNFFDVLGIKHITDFSFNLYQRTYIFPAIHNAWEKEKRAILQEITRRPIVIGGDGQCDSPGHNAKYCVYTFMDLMTNKIIDFEVVQVTKYSSSAAMEKIGFHKCMTRAVENKLNIVHFATDHHSSVRKSMREDFPDINHQFDVWHFAKSITKKLRRASNSKNMEPLKDWVTKIQNHFWWCVSNCWNDEDKLRKNWLGVMHHVINVHEWEEDGILQRCAHSPLTDDDIEETHWLHAGTSVYEKLYSIVNDKNIIADLKHLTWSCHTGPIEVFHSKVLKYRTKRIHFGIDGMHARTILAVLSNNFNVNRKQAVVKKKTCVSGELGSKRVKFVAPKGRNDWITRPVYEDLKFDYLHDILIETLQLCEGTITSSWVSKSTDYPSNISKLP
ncbi:uncharacterized protein [Hyperolius riggenbachi]|uniref:uncharacterized protein n=1 Tax=Hyperolius riggenbachi TaxID=752182 RepID=UPI0035A39689